MIINKKTLRYLCYSVVERVLKQPQKIVLPYENRKGYIEIKKNI